MLEWLTLNKGMLLLPIAHLLVGSIRDLKQIMRFGVLFILDIYTSIKLSKFHIAHLPFIVLVLHVWMCLAGF